MIALVTLAACFKPEGWDKLRYWTDDPECEFYSPNDTNFSIDRGLAWKSQLRGGITAGGGPDGGESFHAEFECLYQSIGHGTIEVYVHFDRYVEDTEARVDGYFESVVFDTEEEFPGMSEISDTEHDWERIGGTDHYLELEFISEAKLQYIFHDANLSVLVKIQLGTGYPMDDRLRGDAFEAASAIAGKVRADSEYDF